MSAVLEREVRPITLQVKEDFNECFNGIVPRPFPKITPRQIEIINEIFQGHAQKEMATAMGVELKTIQFHAYRMHEKMGFEGCNSAEIAAKLIFNYRNGLKYLNEDSGQWEGLEIHAQHGSEQAPALNEDPEQWEILEMHAQHGSAEAPALSLPEYQGKPGQPLPGIVVPPGCVGFTPRQAQVVALIVAGKSNKEIANILGFSPKTVEFHKDRIKEKLRLDTWMTLTKDIFLHHGRELKFYKTPAEAAQAASESSLQLSIN